MVEDAADGESRAGRLSVIGWGLGRRGLLRKSIVDVEREAEWESLGGKERAFMWLFLFVGVGGAGFVQVRFTEEYYVYYVWIG